MKLVKYEILIVFLIIFLTIFLNLFSFLSRSWQTPPGRVFTGAQFYTDDYAVYVSYIRQGQEGRFTTVDKFTSEPHPPSLVHEEYLLWGKLTGLFHLSPIFSYHLARLIFGLLFLFLIYFFLKKIFPTSKEFPQRLLTLILICFSNGFLNKSGQPFLSWLTEADSTQRFAALPHYLIGFSLSLTIFLWYFSESKNWLWPLFFGLVLSFVLPSSFLIVLGTLAVFFIFSKKSFRLGFLLAILFLSFLPSFFYYQRIFQIPPWSHIFAWEKANRPAFNFWEYLAALGPTAFLFPLGIFAPKEKRRWVIFFFILVGVVFLFAFFVADRLNLNPTRFLQFPLYIPFAILTIFGLSCFLKKPLSLAIFTLVLLVITLPTSFVSLKNQKEMYADFSELIYPTNELKTAFDFLVKNTSPNQTVLTLYQAGNLIPFFAGNKVYLGHLQETLNYPLKVKLAEDFFAGKMTLTQAKEFLSQGKIDLVFLSPQEKSLGGKIEIYPFLEPIYQSQTITIFKVKND